MALVTAQNCFLPKEDIVNLCLHSCNSLMGGLPASTSWPSIVHPCSPPWQNVLKCSGLDVQSYFYSAVCSSLGTEGVLWWRRLVPVWGEELSAENHWPQLVETGSLQDILSQDTAWKLLLYRNKLIIKHWAEHQLVTENCETFLSEFSTCL